MAVLASAPSWWRRSLVAVLVLYLASSLVSAQKSTSTNNKQSQQNKHSTKANNVAVDRVEMVCPAYSARHTTFLTLPCTRQADCLFGDLCCATKLGSKKSRCYQGVPKPLPELPHQPLFGMIPLTCPKPPVAELLAVTKCDNDTDCWPRICCPDGRQRFCRTPAPHWEEIPHNQQLPVLQMLRNAMKYLQCSDRPEAIFDLFPRSCQSPRDCFPDLCCQEGSRKVCRRPRSSILALLSSLTTPITTLRKSLTGAGTSDKQSSQAPVFFLPSWTQAQTTTKAPPRRKAKPKQLVTQEVTDNETTSQ